MHGAKGRHKEVGTCLLCSGLGATFTSLSASAAPPLQMVAPPCPVRRWRRLAASSRRPLQTSRAHASQSSQSVSQSVHSFDEMHSFEEFGGTMESAVRMTTLCAPSVHTGGGEE